MKYNVLYLVVCLFLVASCTKIPDHAKYIPKNTQFVATIDMNKMGKKLIWNALTGSELFKEIQKNMSSEDSKNAMKDISNIGLNQNSSVYCCFNMNHPKNASSSVIVGMKDQHAFESFLKKTYPAILIEKGTGFSSAMIEHSMLAAWNAEAAIFYPISENEQTNAMTYSFRMNDPTQIKANLGKIFSIGTSESILSNAHFKALQKEGHDIGLWLNYDELYAQNVDPSTNPFIKQEYFKDAGLASGIDFEKGKATMVMDYYMSKDMATIYKKYEPKSIDMDMIKKIPSTNIDMIAGYNINPLMIQEYMKKFGLDGLLNMGLGLAGTSMERIAGTFKGDLIFALSDMNMKAVTDTTKYDENADRTPDMKMMLAMSINDMKSLEQLLGIGVKNKMLIKNGATYRLPDTNSTASFAYNKNAMVYSSDAATTSSYLAGTGNSQSFMPADVWKHFSNSPMVMYIDMKKVMATIPLKTHSTEEEVFTNDLKSFFNYIEFYGGKMKNEAVHIEGAMVLKNEAENALIQLLDLGMKAKKMKDAVDRNVPKTDSTLIP